MYWKNVPSKARLNVFRNTIRYSGAYIWNNLHAKVKNVSSVEMFKTSYLKLNFSQYPSIHTNYIISHCTTLWYNHNIWHGT